jgi:hypothetical protein
VKGVLEPFGLIGVKHGFMSGPGALLKDTFTDPDGTLVTAHKMDIGAGWTMMHGDGTTLTIQGGKATSTASDKLFLADAGKADVVLTANFTATDVAGAFGFLLRSVTLNDMWQLIANSAAEIAIVESAAGVQTVRSRLAMTFTAGSTYTLKATAKGRTMTLEAFSGATSMGSTSYSLAAHNETVTKHGIQFTAAKQVDNLEAQAAP